MTRPLPVAARLRAARIKQKIKQHELAELVGTSRREVGRWEREGVTPHPRFAAPLAVHLGLDPDTLRAAIDAEHFDKRNRDEELDEEAEAVA